MSPAATQGSEAIGRRASVTQRGLSVVELAEREVRVDEIRGRQRGLWRREFG
jgi:hypothetical protein